MTDRADPAEWSTVGATALGAPGAALIGEVVTEADPDLGFRLLLRLLDAYEAPITEARYTRFERLADRLGCGEDYVRRELEHRITR